jgi:hypothetical protein
MGPVDCGVIAKNERARKTEERAEILLERVRSLVAENKRVLMTFVFVCPGFLGVLYLCYKPLLLIFGTLYKETCIIDTSRTSTE